MSILFVLAKILQYIIYCAKLLIVLSGIAIYVRLNPNPMVVIKKIQVRAFFLLFIHEDI